MIIFKKQKSSVFDILNMNVCKIGNIKESLHINNEVKKIEKYEYRPLDLGAQEKQLSKEKELEVDHLHAKYFGLATHYCLEMISNFDEENLAYVINLAKTRYSNYLSEIDFEDIEKRIELLIKNEIFLSLIKDSEFITEQSLIYKEEVKIIDLLLYKDNTYFIVDYKTTKEELEEHKIQVLFYKKAIKEIFNTPNVKSFLVYLKPQNSLIYEV